MVGHAFEHVVTFLSSHSEMVFREDRSADGHPGENLARDRRGQARARDRAHGMRGHIGDVVSEMSMQFPSRLYGQNRNPEISCQISELA